MATPITEADVIGKLVAVRRERGLTLAQVARRMHVTPPAVTMFERGYRSPTLFSILRYAHAVGATLDVGSAAKWTMHDSAEVSDRGESEFVRCDRLPHRRTISLGCDKRCQGRHAALR